MNGIAYKALGSPSAVEFYFDEHSKKIGLRRCDASKKFAFRVKQEKGKDHYLIYAGAFCTHFAISTKRTLFESPEQNPTTWSSSICPKPPASAADRGEIPLRRLNVFDAYTRDRVTAVAAAYFRRTSGDGDANNKLAVIELADHSVGQIEVDSTVLRQIYLAQLDRVEGHGDLVNG